MPTDSASLLVHCQMALGLTQKELGELMGRDRRTIQRWQESGVDLEPDQARTLANALKPVRPDLADQLLDLCRKASSGGAPPIPAAEDVVEAILRAAAEAVGTSPEAIRPAITAALVKAEEAGVEVKALLLGLKSSG